MGRNALIFRWRAQSSSLSYVFYLSVFGPFNALLVCVLASPLYNILCDDSVCCHVLNLY